MRSEHLWAVYEAVSASISYARPFLEHLRRRDCFGNLGQWSRTYSRKAERQ
jgi:hypothetical protein